MSIPQGDIIYGARIEALGNPAAVSDLDSEDARYRFATGRPAGDVYGLYLDVMVAEPEPITQRVDWRAASASYGGTTLELLHTEQVRGLLSRLRSYPVAKLGADLLAGAQTLELDVEGALAAGDTIWCRREALYVLAELSTTTYTVQRGVMDTPIQEHRVARPGADLDVFKVCHTLQARRVEIFAVPAHGGYEDEVVIWSGLLDRAGHSPGAEVVWVELLGPLALLEKPALWPSQWRGEVEASIILGYNAEQPDASPHLIRLQGLAEAVDLEESPAPGGTAQDGSGEQILVAIEDHLYLAENSRDDLWFVETPPAWQGLTDALTLDALAPSSLKGSLARHVLSAHPEAPQPLGQDAVAIWAAVLTSTTDGENGPYDIGINLGVGMPHTALDLEALASLRALWGVVLQAPLFFLGREQEREPVRVQEKLRRELLAPLGLVEIQTQRGLLALARWSDLPVGYAEPHLDDEQILELIAQDYAWDGQVDTVTYRYTPVGGRLSQTRTITPTNQTARERTIGALQEVRVEALALSDYAQVYSLALDTVLRWSQPVPVLTVVTHLSVLLIPGRTCTLSHSALVSMDGPDPVEGAQRIRCMVISRTIDPQAGHCSYQMLHIGLDQQSVGRVAPAAQVASWDAGQERATMEAHLYTPTSGGAYEDDAEPFTAGHACSLIGPDGEVLDGVVLSGPVLVQEPDPGDGAYDLRLTIPAPVDPEDDPVVPGAGDTLIGADYADQTAEQQERDVALCDDSDDIPSASALGFQYL